MPILCYVSLINFCIKNDMPIQWIIYKKCLPPINMASNLANGISNDKVATNAKPPIIIIKPMNQIDYNLEISLWVGRILLYIEFIISLCIAL